jgi:transcriptional pleiotropic regulator of transition state genes
MGETGIVRRVDNLGRIVIPMEYRKVLGIRVHDPVSISIRGEQVVVEKYHDACVLCGSMDDIQRVKDRPLCAACLKEIKQR